MNFREFKAKVKKYPIFGSDILEILTTSPQQLRNQINRWTKKGLILKLKRGLYTLNPEEKESGLSHYFLANNLYSPSYISLESALSHYKLIPERVTSITSVSTRKTKTFTNDLGTYTFRHLKIDLFFGFKEEKDEFEYKYLIAEPEKALLDYLYLNLGKIKEVTEDYFEFSLRLQNRDLLDQKKIRKYARPFATKKLNRLLERL